MNNVFRQLIYCDQVSLTFADVTEIVNEGIQRHALSACQAEIFGAALAATTYMSACLKEKTGQISITLKTQGGEVCVSGNQALHIRGYLDGFTGAEYSAKSVGEGSLTVVRDDGYSRPFVGSCEARAERSVDETIEQYYAISEQLPTFLRSVVKMEKGECVFAGIAVLQPLPFADRETLEKLPTGLALEKIVGEMQTLGLTATAEKYFSADKSAASGKTAKYQCHCSREYLSKVLTTVGKEQLKGIIQEDGCVKAHCHFCNTDYVFFDEDIERIFEDKKV